jgi:hypothetical protein
MYSGLQGRLNTAGLMFASLGAAAGQMLRRQEAWFNRVLATVRVPRVTCDIWVQHPMRAGRVWFMLELQH